MAVTKNITPITNSLNLAREQEVDVMHHRRTVRAESVTRFDKVSGETCGRWFTGRATGKLRKPFTT